MSEDEDGKPPSELTFHYIKSNQFRVTHADGAIGGPTPRGLIQINFYSERMPIPTQTVQPVTEGKLGEEIKERRVSKEGVIRELEVGVIVDLSAAKTLLKWLGEKIDNLEQVLKTQPPEG